MRHRAIPALCVLATTISLAACGGSEQDDIRAWMQSERNSIKPSVQPIPEPTKFNPEPYSTANGMQPFSTEKLENMLRGSTGPVASSALIEPELNRRREPLEAFPLDTMALVGSLDRNGTLVALVKVGALLYQVKPGNYLGLNYGRVMRISETEVVLREIVQDSTGEWTERPAALQLVEGNSK